MAASWTAKPFSVDAAGSHSVGLMNLRTIARSSRSMVDSEKTSPLLDQLVGEGRLLDPDADQLRLEGHLRDPVDGHQVPALPHSRPEAVEARGERPEHPAPQPVVDISPFGGIGDREGIGAGGTGATCCCHGADGTEAAALQRRAGRVILAKAGDAPRTCSPQALEEGLDLGRL